MVSLFIQDSELAFWNCQALIELHSTLPLAESITNGLWIIVTSNIVRLCQKLQRSLHVLVVHPISVSFGWIIFFCLEVTLLFITNIYRKQITQLLYYHILSDSNVSTWTMNTFLSETHSMSVIDNDDHAWSWLLYSLSENSVKKSAICRNLTSVWRLKRIQRHIPPHTLATTLVDSERKSSQTSIATSKNVNYRSR